MHTTIEKGAIALAIVLGISLFSRAQTETGSPVPPDDVPQFGAFFSAQNWPPMPYDWVPDLPVDSLGNGRFVIDDSSVNYADPASWGGTRPGGGNEGARSMDDSGPPSPPGDGGGGTNSSGGVISTYVFSTNGLWLQIVGISNGIVSFTLNNATDMVYEIFSAVSLTNSLTNWNIERAVWPVTNQAWTPFTVEIQDRTNSLFFGARDWTGVTSYGNLITPEWWLYQYFGTVDLSETNLDPEGNTLLYDYQNSLDPNVISFSLSATNRYFNTSSATVQLAVSAGWPSYMAALVDNTNFSAAYWSPYNSNFVFNLGSVEGWHSVWVGLRGLPPNAQQTWEQNELKLILTPPVLIITNPIPGVVTQPMIEVQGVCTDPLASLTFDVTNAAGFFTNQQVFVLSQYYDTNAGGFTTNTFQAFDVPLTNGDNIVTFHATDMAGNVTTTNFTFTLDYSGKTNPPAIQVFWPQNDDQVSGTEFTLRGSLDDFTASLTAQIVDASGGTNTVQGLVERNGLFWVENVPLLVGTNYVTLAAMDAVGNISTTNLTISVSAGLTIDDFSGELGGTPRNIIPVVSGSVMLTNYTIWVNGVQASQDGQGNWDAYSVPVGAGGTAVVEARAIPNSDNNGNGTGTTPPSDGTPGNPTAADSMAAQTQIDQPATCYMQEYQYCYSSTEIQTSLICSQVVVYVDQGNVDWVLSSEGNSHWFSSETDTDDCGGSGVYSVNYEYSWGCNSCPVLQVVSCDGEGVETNIVDLATALEDSQSVDFAGGMASAIWDLSETYSLPYYGGSSDNFSDEETVCSQWTLQTGGKGMAGRQNLFEIDVSAENFISRVWVDPTLLPFWLTAPVPMGGITDLGQTPNANGQIFTVLPDNTTMDITPQAPPQRYTYSVGATKYPSYFTAYDEEPKPGGPRWDIVTIWGFTAGHAWWCLSNGAPPEGLYKAGISYFNQEFLNKQVGYFSQIRPASIFDDVPGILRIPGNGDRIDAQRQFQIGINELSSSLNFTAGLSQNPGWYILYSAVSGGAHNCVTTTIQAGAFSGVALPNDKTPQNFGIDLNAMPNQ